jgi:hypothetical protein
VGPGFRVAGLESLELERSEEKGLEELGAPGWQEIHLHRALQSMKKSKATK